MWFWVYMLVIDLLIPLTMIIFGRIFMRAAPKEINSTFGYRTGRSMQNRDTWDFAHRYFGRIWFVCGLIILPLSLIAMVFVLGQSERAVGYAGTAVCLVQLVLMVLAIVPTEAALKKNFDTNGQRK